MATTAGGRNTKVENLVAIDSPSAAPNQAPERASGWASARRSASSASRKVATNATSVVDRPAWATTGGKVASEDTARNATQGSFRPPASTQVKARQAQKNPRFASRPSVTLPA